MFYLYQSDILTPELCNDLIDTHPGLEEAHVNIYGKLQRQSKIRNNRRTEWHDESLATLLEKNLQEKLLSMFPFQLNDFTYARTGSRFRLYHYVPGQYFKPHRDGHNTEKNLESLVTALFYLNTPEGGETVLMPSGYSNKHEHIEFSPRQESVLLFEHDFWHEGRPVSTGEKYVLRTDLFYTVK